MKRFTFSQLSCGLAFAFLLSPSVMAQSGGSFGSPVQSGAFSSPNAGSTPTNSSSTQFTLQDSNLGGLNSNGSQSIQRQPKLLGTGPGASSFNPTPFRVTGAKASSALRPAKNRQAKAIIVGSGSDTRAGVSQLPSHPSQPTTVTPALKNSNTTTPLPPQSNSLSGKSFSSNKSPSGGTFGSPRTAKPTTAKPTTAKPVSFGSPTNFPAQGRPSFGAPPTKPTQITSNESSGKSSRLPESINCPISSVHFIEDIQLPAREAGEIKTMNFDEGDFVPAGQTIAQINDENYQMMLEQADMRYQIALDTASDSTASQAAKKKYQVASIEARKTERLAGSGSKSDSDKMMANYTKEIAYLEMQKADRERRKALAEAKLALAEKRQVQTKIARHTLRSDFDAYVVEIKKSKQEYVQIGEEVMRIARMDRVWVQSVVDTKELNAHELLNRKVTVTIDLARGETAEFEGVVKFVGLERQGPELLMVKAEVTNRPINGHWILHPEAEVAMEIHLNDETSSALGSTSVPKVSR